MASALEPVPNMDLVLAHDEPVLAPRGDSLVQRVVDSDAVGTSGERLTRDEAFGLVARAVAALTRDATDAARASEVRRVARELLGRDSESLSERNFTRILRDAHDADIIDLRRRGDDFEVARAAEAAPVAEQLRVLDAVAAAATATSLGQQSLPPRRMLGPRGIPGRGRAISGRPSSLPPELLSIGLVTVDRAVGSIAPPLVQPLSAEASDGDHAAHGARPVRKKRAAKKAAGDESTAASKPRRPRAKKSAGRKDP